MRHRASRFVRELWKCGAVDAPAKMADDPVARLAGVPQWPPAPGEAAARAYLLQPVRAKTQQARAGQPRFLGSRFASPSRTANVAELQRRPRVGSLQAASDRTHGDVRNAGNRGDSPMPRRPGFRRSEKPSLPFIPLRQYPCGRCACGVFAQNLHRSSPKATTRHARRESPRCGQSAPPTVQTAGCGRRTPARVRRR